MNKNIVVDVETTGLDKTEDEILQVCIINDQGTILFYEYVKPVRKTVWEEAEKINHLTYDMLKDGHEFSYYRDKIQQIIDDAEMVIGYNTQFDIGFLEQAGIRTGHLKQADVMRDFAFIYGEWSDKYSCYKFKPLGFCASYYQHEWEGRRAHDALADCMATLHSYKCVETDKKKIKEKMMRSAIVYFSRAGENYFGGKFISVEKGNTKKVAECLQELTGGDMIELVMEKPYSDVYLECVAEAKKHFEEKARPALKGLPESMDGYDVIYLGYPNYCGTIPMPVATFLESFDLKGKRIMPFCTNEGSGFGRSLEDIREIVPKAVLGNGLAIIGGQADNCMEDVISWLEEAKLM